MSYSYQPDRIRDEVQEVRPLCWHGCGGEGHASSGCSNTKGTSLRMHKDRMGLRVHVMDQHSNQGNAVHKGCFTLVPNLLHLHGGGGLWEHCLTPAWVCMFKACACCLDTGEQHPCTYPRCVGHGWLQHGALYITTATCS
jgi:hypothetical protein